MTYRYVLPTTKPFSFSEAVVDPGSYSAALSEATALRGRLRSLAKALKRTEEQNRDWGAAVTAAEEYLPYLVAFIQALDGGELKLNSSAEWSWKSTINSASGLKKHQHFISKSVTYELIFTLLTYAYALSMHASAIAAGITPESPNGDRLYNMAADALNTASSIFAFISGTVIDQWQSPPRGRPADTTRELTAALSKLAFGDAQSIGIRKITSTSKASYSLVAKLYVGVFSQYEMAFGLMNSLKGSEITSDFKKYVTDGMSFYRAMARKYLAMDAYETQQNGKAVALINEVKESLHSLTKSSLPGKTNDGEFYAIASSEEADVNELCSTYHKINDSVTFETVPPKSALPNMMPSGRELLKPKTYTLPNGSFGVASHGNERQPYALKGAYY